MSASFEASERVRAALRSACEDIARIRSWAEGHDLASLKADHLTRYAIERAFIAVDSALRDVPAALLERFSIPARAITGFRNALAHTYDDILDQRVILTIHEDLPVLEATLLQAEASLSQPPA